MEDAMRMSMAEESDRPRVSTHCVHATSIRTAVSTQHGTARHGRGRGATSTHADLDREASEALDVGPRKGCEEASDRASGGASGGNGVTFSRC